MRQADRQGSNIDVVKGILHPVYHVQAAINGKVALDLMARKKPDLILLDIMMPELDGYEVCRRIKENPETRTIPIIFLTAKGQVADEAKGFKMGAADYIMKPVNPAILVERVGTHIALSDQRKKLASALGEVQKSIRYASRIQRSTLPDENILGSIVADHFVLWEPRDVVGGDIYWWDLWGDGLLLILGDCTGHGVPGAFVTLLASGVLDRAKGEVEPGDLPSLPQRMHQLLKIALGQHDEAGEVDDGMELGACYLDMDARHLRFSGARFNLFTGENGRIGVAKGVRKTIGYREIPDVQDYPAIDINLKPGMSFYLTTDGLIDQVGGERRRSFGGKRVISLLEKIHNLPMAEQRTRIHQALNTYQGDEPRRDDVSIIGFRIW